MRPSAGPGSARLSAGERDEQSARTLTPRSRPTCGVPITISRTVHPAFGSASGGHELADVLLGLGHACPLGCSRAAAELGAPVVLTRPGLPLPLHERPTLVVVDSGASGAPLGRSYHLVRFLDRCARSDGIRVRDRRASDVVGRASLRRGEVSTGFAMHRTRLLQP